MPWMLCISRIEKNTSQFVWEDCNKLNVQKLAKHWQKHWKFLHEDDFNMQKCVSKIPISEKKNTTRKFALTYWRNLTPKYYKIITCNEAWIFSMILRQNDSKYAGKIVITKNERTRHSNSTYSKPSSWCFLFSGTIGRINSKRPNSEPALL